MDDSSPKRSLVDDPGFLDQLADLDSGLSGSRPDDRPGAYEGWDELEPAVAPAPQPTSQPRPLPPPPPPGQAAYETFYGLREATFESRPDLRFLFHSASFDRASQECLAAIGRHDGILVLTGAPGSGKTTVCQFVLAELGRRTVTSLVSQRVRTAGDLLKTVLVDFGVISKDDLASGRLPATTHTGLMTALREFLASLGSLQASAVVVIDDAHDLPLEVMEQLRVLSEAIGPTALQIVLAGGPDLMGVLDQYELRQLNERIHVHIDLAPLSADEIRSYVLFRLGVANPNVALTFESDALQRLFTLSRGNPAMVNQLCLRALMRGSERSASVIDASLIGENVDVDIAPPRARGKEWLRMGLIAVGLVALVCVGAAGAAWVFHDSFNRMVEHWQAVQARTAAPRR